MTEMPKMTPTEIDDAETSLGVRLPNIYRQLLADVGYGRWGDLEIYHPATVRELYEPFFDDPAQLFSPYFPFGCDNRLQQLWIIDAVTSRAASIWHETVPDDWPEEQWYPCDVWRQRYLPSK